MLFGKLRPYLKNWLLPDFSGVAVGDFWVLKPQNMDSRYLYYLIQTPEYDSVANQSTGTKMPRSDWKLVSNTEFAVPLDREEQEKIGLYFSELDTLITLHQRKYNKIEKYPFFAWEQRKLNEVAQYRNGKAHENNISENGKYIVVNSKFVSTDGDVRKYSDEQIEPLYEGEIAFVLSDVPNGRAIARTFLVEESGKYTLNQRIAGITPNEDTDSYFLHILMNRNKYFLQFDDGNKQTNLSVNDVLQFAEMYPSYTEQQKIGRYFAVLDTLITLHQRKQN